jgi:hypothetical protein
MAEIAYNLRSLIGAAREAEGTALGEHTARQYVAECLPPPTANMAAPYGEEHLLRLRLAIRLAAQYVPVREIARYLDRLSLPATRILLDRPPVPRSPAEGDVQAYLERLSRSIPSSALLPINSHGMSAQPRPPTAVQPRPKRNAARPVAEPEYSEWLRVVVDADVELLVRWRAGGGGQRLAERLAAAVREALAAGGDGS